MASVDTFAFNAGTGGVNGTYDENDPIQVSIGYTPDSPSSVPTTFTLTANLTNAAGTQVATNSSPFVVNVAQPAGDVLSVSDTGNRTWTDVSDNGSVAVFSAVA